MLIYLENKMRDFSISYICEPRTMPGEFIGLGGIIHDVYKFNDGSHYLTMVASRLNCTDTVNRNISCNHRTIS